jgi:hypothetical protein
LARAVNRAKAMAASNGGSSNGESQPMESMVSESAEGATAGEMSGMSAGHSQSDHNPA